MDNDIQNLEPVLLWKNFYEITRIPHPSRYEDALARHIQDMASHLGLKHMRDDVGNVIITKPACKGAEYAKCVALQAHLDMVAEKNAHITHDFEKDPIAAYADGDWVRAKETTLGADNGIGVAAALAVLQSHDIVHGPLEVLFTVNEEAGMTGAFGLGKNVLKADILMNTDSEDEGILFNGCAGSTDAYVELAYEPEELTDDLQTICVRLTGLKGGHSGLNIHLGRANANKLLLQLLKQVSTNCQARIIELKGGAMRNAIPREAYALLAVPSAKLDIVQTALKNFTLYCSQEYQYTDPDITLSFEEVAAEQTQYALPVSIQTAFIHSAVAAPNGVYSMSFTAPDKTPDTVATSCNMGIIKIGSGKIHIQILIRAFSEGSKQELCSALESCFSLAGAIVSFSKGYPGWNPDPQSTILAVMKDVYKKRWGREPEVKAIHAGLECGIIGATYPSLDMISFGPDIRNPHSPDECVHIKSVARFWESLCLTLEAVARK